MSKTKWSNNQNQNNKHMNNIHINMKKYTLAVMLVMGSILNSNAQQFAYKSKVDKVKKDGFYKIKLSPEISAQSNAYMNDLRLFDQTGKEVPYLYKKESPYQSDVDFVSYAILENQTGEEWQTVVVENGAKTPIDLFILEMNNAETDRVVRLSGSNDRNNWFVIRDSFYLSLLGNSSEAYVRTQLTFPMSKYQYYKIEIKQKNKNPLDILQIGYSKNAPKLPSYQQVNGLTFTRLDSNKKTYVRCTLPGANRIDKLVFQIKSPAMYNRMGLLLKQIEDNYSYPSAQSSGSMKLKRSYSKESSDFVLNSDRERIVLTHDFLGNQKLNYFDIEIENNDNEPLQIESILAYQLSSTLTAELRSDKSYFLYFGDSVLQAPSYDINYFESKILVDSNIVLVGAVEPKHKVLADEYSQSNDKLFVWIGIGVVGLLLLFMTRSMMKKMSDGKA